jgi:hypothetical protein
MLATDKTYTATKGQKLFDIAIQEYGDIDGVAWLCEDNNITVIPYDFPGTLSSDLGGTTLKMRVQTINPKAVEELRPYNPIISE